MTTQATLAPPPPAPAVPTAKPTAEPMSGAAVPAAPRRQARKFTVAEYYRMVDAGILRPRERVELIEGVILAMPPIGPFHAEGVDYFLELFSRHAAGRFRVRIQAPVHLGEHLELEPDMALLRLRPGGYRRAHPTPEDILLITEVADSTLDYDRDIKAPLYGRAGIPETWVVNLREDCLEVFRNPGPQGYAQHTLYRRGDKISPVALPDLEFAVAELLPPAPEPAG